MSGPGLPTADDFFGKSGGDALPTADEFFKPPAPSMIGTDIKAAGALMRGDYPAASQAVDEYYQQAPVGRIMDAFGQGAKHAWGADTAGLSEESEAFLRKAGIFNDYADGRTSIIKSFNEAIIRPVAAGVDAGLRGLSAGFGGAAAAVEQAGKEVGAPKLGREAAGLIEFAGQTGVPEVTGGMHAPSAEIPRARSLGVIGEGEGGYAGTKSPTPISEAARADAVKQTAQAAAEAPELTGAPPEGAPETITSAPEAAPSAAVAAPDIHTVAREIEPATFQEYDRLTAQRTTFRRWIGELDTTRREQAEADAPHGEEIQDLQERLADPDTTRRLAKKYQDRLEELQDEREAFIADKVKGDSADMARIRDELQKTDYRMRDLAPDVSSAYRKAEERLGPETAEATAPAQEAGEPGSVEAEQPTPAEAAPQPETQPQPVVPETLGGQTKSSQLDSIASEVSKRLTVAGRPKEEADAAGQILAAYYDTRAARFGGTKGSAYELYAREVPNIKAGGKTERVKELAQAKTLGQTKRGSITINKARNTIRLFKDANASTFIHETGHQWLEDLLQDARDDQAPADLLHDAKTVRDWLGAKDGEAITTRQHERFARGFERYMMEGVAPSKSLAAVFAKFKDWLTKIYQTVSRLRSPITDDIRDVFDRLLSTAPEKATIAPEHEVPRELADRHEELAENTPPERAAAVADAIEKDVDDAVKSLSPEVHDELPHKLPGEVQGTDALPDRGGNAAEPVPGAEGRAEERGAVAESGNEVAAESANQPEPGTTSESTKREPAATGEPNAANEPFGKPESDFLDKAGNIRLDNIDTPEDVKEVIRETASANSDFIAERRGVMSDSEVIDLADALGMDAGTLDKRKIGEAFNAEQIRAAQKLLIASATNLKNLARAAATGTDADVMAYAAAKQQHRMIQGQFSGVTAEAGRALRAFRRMKGREDADLVQQVIQEDTGRTLNQLKKEAALMGQLDDSRKVGKFVHDSMKPTFLDMIQEFWINSLLSGPRTHVKNIVGNAVVALNSIAETAGASVVGKVLGSKERVELNEAKARFFGITQGAKDGIIAARAIMDSEDAIIGTHTVEKAHTKAIPGVVGKIVRIPTRLLSVEDEIFKAIGYRQELNALAYREANTLGLSGEAFNAHVARRITDPPEAMMEAARKNAEYQTFTNALGPTGRAIQNFANSHFLAKFLVPFIRTPVNLLKFAGERTALGLASKSIRSTVLGSDTIARDTQISRMAIGTAMSIGVAYAGLALAGSITGGGPSDPKQRAMLRMTGWAPYSVRVGQIYYSYQWLDPFSTIAGMTSDMTDIVKYGEDKGETWEKISADAMGSLLKSVASKTSLRGISDFLQMASDPDRYGEGYINGFAAGFVPGLVGQSAQMLDPDVRQTRSALDAIKAKIPFLSQDLPVQRDIWGNELLRGDVLGPNIASPIYESAMNSDPVNQTLLQSGYYPGYPSRKIRGVELTDQQYDDYSRISGRLAKIQLDKIVALPAFATLPAIMRLDMVRSAVENSRENARSLILMNNKGLIQQAVQAKLQAELGKGPAPH